MSPNPSLEIKKKSQLSKEDWNQYFTGHWNFNGVRQDKHLAMFLKNCQKTYKNVQFCK